MIVDTARRRINEALRPGNESRLRLQTIVRLRWFALAGQLLTVAVVYGYFGFDLPLGLCLLLIAMSAWLNVFLRMRFPATHRLSPEFATAQLGYDILQLGALLYLTGGIDNPFTVLVVAPVTVSAATLPTRNTVMLGIAALIVTMIVAITHLPLPWSSDGAFQLPVIYKIGALASVTACLAFLALYAWRLAKEANEMTTALAATELVLAREQRLHALDGLAAAAAHELGTPLATIVLIAGELEREHGGNAHFAEDLTLLKSQAQRCREILQTLTRSPSERDPLHAEITLAQIADEAAAPYRDRGVDIRITQQDPADSDSPAPIAERRPGVLYGVGNLIENAADFAQSAVEIELGWTRDEAVLTIKDDGPGFPLEVLEQLGNPYLAPRRSQTTQAMRRRSAGGLGLGIFIAKTLLERSGATLRPSNRVGPQSGAVMVVVWPRDRFEAAIAETPQALAL